MKINKKIRNKYGLKIEEGKGKYPIFNVKSALSAIRLRHHSKDVSAKTVLNKVSHSPFSSNPTVKSALIKAREVDKKR